MMNVDESPRRPIALRANPWSQRLARVLTASGISPNAISIAGLCVAVGAGLALDASGTMTGPARVALLLVAALGVQLRLLCNMLDGMVAVEGGRRTPHGDIFNDMPDRFADIAVLVGAGFSLTAFPWGPALGLSAALLAVLTAYVRLLGASLGTPHYFLGPMAKPHRMETIAVASVVAVFEPAIGMRGDAIAVALAIVIAGSIVTFVRRTQRIVADVGARS